MRGTRDFNGSVSLSFSLCVCSDRPVQLKCATRHSFMVYPAMECVSVWCVRAVEGKQGVTECSVEWSNEE